MVINKGVFTPLFFRNKYVKNYQNSYQKIIMPIVVFVSSVLPISAMANCKRPPNLYGFDDIACPYDGFSKVEKNAKYGFVDLNGQILIPADYDDATSFSEGLAELVQNGQSFFINTQGKKVFSVDKNIDVISDFHESKSSLHPNTRKRANSLKVWQAWSLMANGATLTKRAKLSFL